MPFREAAVEIGKKLIALGQCTSFPFYMKIIAATDRALTTGNFGDLTTRGPMSLIKATEMPFIKIAQAHGLT